MPDFAPNPRTDPTLVDGYRGVTSHVSDRVVVDMQDRILRYMPEATPFMTLTAKIKGKRKAVNRKFEWLEKDYKPRKVTATAALTPTGTSLTVSAADGDKLAANDIIQNTANGDIALVSTESAGTVTIVRAIGGAGQVGASGDEWIILGSSYPDNATLGTMKSITENAKFNYTQIFRTPFGFTGRDLVTELYGGSDKMTETKWQGVEHKRSIEFALLFGKRHVIDASGSTHERTFTGGVESNITTNVWDVNGISLTERAFTEFLEEGLRWGKGGRLQGGAATKYLLASDRWLTEINSWAADRLEYRVLDDEIGFSAMEYKSPHGRVMLVSAPLLVEHHPDYAFLLDLNHLDYVYLRQRDTKLLSGREANDLDGEAYEYFSDVGIQVEFEQSHALLKGLSV